MVETGHAPQCPPQAMALLDDEIDDHVRDLRGINLSRWIPGGLNDGTDGQDVAVEAHTNLARSKLFTKIQRASMAARRPSLDAAQAPESETKPLTEDEGGLSKFRNDADQMVFG